MESFALLVLVFVAEILSTKVGKGLVNHGKVTIQGFWKGLELAFP